MDIRFIDDNGHLDACVTQLHQTDKIAVDLEFDKNLYRYGFNLCLVQIYDGQSCWLVDPLSNALDIEKLFPVLEEEEIEKVVFAFGEDLRLLHSLGCFPQNIYDLDIATSLLNYPPGSLNKLIEDLLDVKTAKSSQQSNWYTRPLADKQVTYAAEDVYYLLRLKEILAQEAKEKNIAQWIEEENAAYDGLNFSDEDDKNFIKDKDKKGFNEFDWFVFKNLLEFREELARRINRPSFKIIKKDFLKGLARSPGRINQWEQARGIYRSLKNRETKEALREVLDDSISKARELNLSKDEPARDRLSDEEYKALKQERSKINKLKGHYFKPIKDKIADDYGQEAASFMLSNRIIAELVTDEDRTLEGYKRELILDYARRLNLDVETILRAVD